MDGAEGISQAITRRRMLATGCAFGGVLLVGCSGAPDERRNAASADGSGAAQVAARPAMVVHKDPNCGCCQSWADIAQRAGYSVQIVNEEDMAAVKARFGVPDDLGSCHTTEVSGLVVEGHVPLDAVDRMLRERPQGLRGVAVPGMPAGSPGMEVPDGRTEAFQVIAFFEGGRTGVFAG